MEHLIQLSIAMDDESIKKQAMEVASKHIAKELTNEVFSVNYCGRKEGLSEYAKGILMEVVTQYKDDIIAEASRLVAESIKKSKKYKEMMKDLPEMTAEYGE